MIRAALQAKRLALLAEGEALVREYERLRLTPADRPDHAAHSDRMRLHRNHVRAYLHDLRHQSGDN
jgi:hypothetical protein